VSVVSGTFTDERDGKVYKWVKIGEQVWMADNLNYDLNETVGKCYNYGTYYDVCDTDGRLYNWATAMNLGPPCNTYNTCESYIQQNHQGVCPDGWHIPTYAEWNTLISTVEEVHGAGTAAQHLLANGTDDYEFAALLSGFCTSDNSCNNRGTYGLWWTTNVTTYEHQAFYVMIYKVNISGDILSSIDVSINSKVNQYSIRCIKN
jgi:uncharacterized protein (TIGR02145 family)